MHTLEIDGLTKRYGRTVAVRDLSFSVEPGLVTGFLGPNGSGKSTTMKVLLDLASADGGRATIGGTRYRDLGDPVRTVGVILEPNAFHPTRTGRDHLRTVADGAGIPRTRVDEMLEVAGLEHARGRKVGGYSMGMKQRLGLASALLGDPQVLILDEPGNGLDPQGIRWLRDLLRWRAAEGNTVFVSSHLLAEMEQLADELVVINHGRLVTTGSVEELRRLGTSVRTPRPEELATVLSDAGAEVERRPQGALIVRGMDSGEIGDRAFDAGIRVHELSPQTGSLEEMFLGLTGDADHADVPDGDTPADHRPQQEEDA